MQRTLSVIDSITATHIATGMDECKCCFDQTEAEDHNSFRSTSSGYNPPYWV
jgi:hypothetical protein